MSNIPLYSSPWIDELNAGSAEIVRFHQRPSKLPSANRRVRPYLEIKPEGVHMAEVVVDRWVYVET